MTALDAQIGGDHYKGAIQPFQLSMANGHDACTHAIQKYLTCFKKKGGIEDLRKAHHIVGIRYETMMEYGAFQPPVHGGQILIVDYLRSNNVDMKTAAAITAMELWFQQPDASHLRRADWVRSRIRETARHHYPETYNEEDFV